jgi:Tol biopolymer transport system component
MHKIKSNVFMLITLCISLTTIVILSGCAGGGEGGSNDGSEEFIYCVSVASGGSHGDDGSNFPSINADGRYVAFGSDAKYLVAGDTNGARDIFIHDTQTVTTTRVSVHSSGAQGNSSCNLSSINADGRYVAFESVATNLVTGDTNGARDIFLHDTQTGTTTRVSVDSGGAQSEGGNSDSPSISGDGRYVAFESFATNLVADDTNGIMDIFLHDTQTGTTTCVSVDSGGAVGNGSSNSPSISSDGRYVAFYSVANNLVAGDTNGIMDIFLHDTQTGTTTCVSVDSGGAEGNDISFYPSISADGRYVAFVSAATNLVAGDTNGARDIFLHDTQTGTTARVSVDSEGAQGNDSSSWSPSISADGRYVAFESVATNLVPGDTNGVEDIFIHDTQTGTTTRVSVDSNGTEGDGDSCELSISADGRYVAFESLASNLVPFDYNVSWDVFRVLNN